MLEIVTQIWLLFSLFAPMCNLNWEQGERKPFNNNLETNGIYKWIQEGFTERDLFSWTDNPECKEFIQETLSISVLIN